MADLFTKEAAVELHERPLIKHVIQFRVVLPELRLEFQCDSLSDYSIHGIALRIQPAARSHPLDHRLPGGKDVIPAEKTSDIEISMFLHPGLQCRGVAKQVRRALEFAKGLRTKIERVAL